MAGCAGMFQSESRRMNTLRHELSYLGARNWVVIAEAAFPIQSRHGLRVIRLHAEIPEVVDNVEQVIEEKYHVKPRLYVSSEAKDVPYDYAPGIKNYHEQLEQALRAFAQVIIQAAAQQQAEEEQHHAHYRSRHGQVGEGDGHLTGELEQ